MTLMMSSSGIACSKRRMRYLVIDDLEELKILE
jgi:hypothetical protein